VIIFTLSIIHGVSESGCVSIFKRHLEGSLEKACFTHFTSFFPIISISVAVIGRKTKQNKKSVRKQPNV
jgi:hypothetical protein